MIQILLIEDNETDSLILKKRVQHMDLQIHMVQVPSLAQAHEAVLKNNFDLVLCDLNVEDSSGLETFKKFHTKYTKIPIVIFSGEADEQMAVEAVRLGAQDYIVKGKIDTNDLKRVFLFAIERKKNEAKQEEYVENLYKKFLQIDSLISQSKSSEADPKAQDPSTLQNKQKALLELLAQLENERKNLKQEVMANADHLLLPLILKLKTKVTDESLIQQLELLEKNVHEITAPFGSEITRKSYGLTNKEIEICNMIKKGLSTKEIANFLNSSPLTVEKHRNSVRKKLGLANKETKLSRFLKEM
jgi:DNA-binding NarL/FixJ family response regulator